jgi:hypothetical protein
MDGCTHILQNSEIVGIINELIRINNDRIHLYARAILDLAPEDRDLARVLEANKRKIECHNAFLEEEVRDLGGEVAAGEPHDGNRSFKSTNRHAVLMNCICGELVAQRVYHSALDNPRLPGYLQELLGVQREELERMYRRLEGMKATAF